jgi:ATP-dependent DNA helicase RecQ
LKEHRLTLAKEKNVPAFVIFPDRSLIDMASKLPGSLDAMRSVHGVGEKKLQQYGDEFLQIIKQAIEANETPNDA